MSFENLKLITAKVLALHIVVLAACTNNGSNPPAVTSQNHEKANALMIAQPSDWSAIQEAFREHDYQAALKLMLPFGQAGDAEIQNEIGFLYKSGDLGTPDYEKAKIWFDRSAAKGNLNAKYNLASLYENGQGVPANERKARQIYLDNYRKGHTGSANAIGLLELKQSHSALALDWFLKSIQAGHYQSMQTVSYILEQQNRHTEAEKYQSLLAREPSHLSALDFLEYIKSQIGDKKVEPIGFRKIAYAFAYSCANEFHYKWGNLMESGTNFPPNYQEALFWYQTAALTGHLQAKERVLALRSKLYQPDARAILAKAEFCLKTQFATCRG